MNYLAHLHIASVTSTSLTGNLLGDFVKGEVGRLAFNDEIKRGIKLHRAVDSYTDAHPYTKSLTKQLGELRRYGGIIVDVLYDHQLSIQFAKFHQLTLSEFAQDCYQQLDTDIAQLPPRYINMVTAMKNQNWLPGYGQINNIHQALVGISQRLKKPVPLIESLKWYQQANVEIEQTFPEFYHDVLNYSCKVA